MGEVAVDFKMIIEDAEKIAGVKPASETQPAGNAQESADAMRSDSENDMFLLEESVPAGNKGVTSRVFLGDNLAVLKGLIGKEKVDLIYIDPPFYSDSSYDTVATVDGKQVKLKAYDDRWPKGRSEYLTELAARLILMREILSDTGLIWLHLDWHTSHYAKVLMDMIFGEDDFVNEIIWTYKSGGSTKKRFARKHDNILVYSKTESYRFNTLKEKSYNRDMKPYRFKGVEEFQDENGWYTVVNMKDVWDIDMVGRTSGERTGYATQKPEKLMERIIESSSEKGSLCCDFFSGSGAFASAAAKMGRSVIASDISPAAALTTFERVRAAGPAKLFSSGMSDGSDERLVVELEAEETPDGIRVGVTAISEKALSEYVDKKALKDVEAVVEEAPQKMIKGMSVSADDGDGVHRALVTKEAPQESWEVIIAKDLIKKEQPRILSVKVWDVLGNFTYKSILI